jgi:uncharacterized membrane protein YeaQ/YmgE (transglycosylase-associated protein family)
MFAEHSAKVRADSGFAGRGTAPDSSNGRATVIGFIVGMVIIGLIAGFIARALVPGRDPIGVLGTILLGIVGSFVGGFLGYVLFGKDVTQGAIQPSGIVGSIIGAVIVLMVWRAMANRRVGYP